MKVFGIDTDDKTKEVVINQLKEKDVVVIRIDDVVRVFAENFINKNEPEMNPQEALEYARKRGNQIRPTYWLNLCVKAHIFQEGERGLAIADASENEFEFLSKLLIESNEKTDIIAKKIEEILDS